MSKLTTILLAVLAVGAIVFLAIYEPLTRSAHESAAIARDGNVLHFLPGDIRVIRIITGDDELEIQRHGNTWQLGEKSKDRADPAVIAKILQTAASLPFIGHIEGGKVNSEDESDFGLRQPKRKIEFEGNRKVTLSFGREAANEDRVYARSSESDDVYLIEDAILQMAFQDLAALRDPRLTALTADRIDRLMIRREGGEIELMRDATGWHITKPLQTKADDQKVTAYLNHLLALRILEYMGEDAGDLGGYGIVEGKKEITFLADGSEHRKTLRLGEGDSGKIFGQFTARDSVYRLPAVAMKLLQVKPESLRDKHMLRLNPDIVDKIHLRTETGEFILQRNPTGWELRNRGAVHPVSPAVMQAFWTAMGTAKVSNYLPATGADLAKFGLTPPLVRLEFFSVLSENTPESGAGDLLLTTLALGQSPDGSVYARLDESPELAAVAKSLLDAVPRQPAAWTTPPS